MSKKEKRRLVTCERCERTYPGFRREDGTLRVVRGTTCPRCGSSSLAEAGFDPSLTLSCPNCGAEHGGTDDLPLDTGDVTTTGHDPDGIVEVTCAECGETFGVGYDDGG